MDIFRIYLNDGSFVDAILHEESTPEKKYALDNLVSFMNRASEKRKFIIFETSSGDVCLNYDAIKKVIKL